jgi:lipid-binding SYLF domain-containing protein
MASVSAASLEDRKAELQQKTETTLQKLYQKEPQAQQVIEKCAGYAVFNNTGFKLGILGGAHGRGMAVNNRTGEEVYMKMGEYQAGLGLGIKEYAVIFVFGTEEAWSKFVNSGWKFNGQATAAADDGVNGGALDGAVMIGDRIWIYQMTTKGLALELAVKGTEYYRDKSFYPSSASDR